MERSILHDKTLRYSTDITEPLFNAIIAMVEKRGFKVYPGTANDFKGFKKYKHLYFGLKHWQTASSGENLITLTEILSMIDEIFLEYTVTSVVIPVLKI